MRQEQEKINFGKVLVVLGGLPLSGKSTLGRELARKTNITYLDADETRRQLFLPWEELSPKEQQELSLDIDPADYLNGRMVLPGDWERFAMMTVYQKNHELARDLLDSGIPVAIGATYSRESYHEMLRYLSSRTGSPINFFLVTAPDDHIAARLQDRIQRDDLSNVRSMEHYLTDKNRYTTIQGVEVTPIDTSLSLGTNIEQILEKLNDLRLS